MRKALHLARAFWQGFTTPAFVWFTLGMMAGGAAALIGALAAPLDFF